MNRTVTPASALSAELAQILDAYVAALESGTAPDKTELLTSHPELANDLEACLASLEFIGAAVAPGAAAEDAPFDGEPVEALRQPIGDFRVIREIGRGGMGVVYEAEQLSLSRRVAIKVLPFAAVLDSKHVKRFKNEAQAAASLDHPHIVSIYAVGCERGVHYYAMQYIEGHSLAELLEASRNSLPADRDPGDNQAETVAYEAKSTLSTLRGHAYFRRVAEICRDAAEALHHAHEMGIVHRDIKPSNLMLDLEGILYVTDFGLAMTQTDTGLTMTGDLLGTLRYMSPEQAEGRREGIDYRSDIYSLGLTLYELLTRRMAFDEEDRGGLLRCVIEEEPPLPRNLDPTIPRDLETIALRAIAKEPRERYASMEQFGGDLTCFLENRPVTARRTRAAERVSKWLRRHIAFTWSVTALVLIVAIIVTIAYRREVILRRQAVTNYQLAEQSSRLAWDVTFSAFEGLMDEIDNLPHTLTLERDALDKAIWRFRSFSATADLPTSLNSLSESAIARLLVRRAENSWAAGSSMEDDLSEAIRILESLHKADASDSAICELLSEAYLENASHLCEQLRYREALRFSRQASAVAPLRLGKTVHSWCLRNIGSNHAALRYMFDRLRRIKEEEQQAGRCTIQSAIIRSELADICIPLGRWDEALVRSLRTRK